MRRQSNMEGQNSRDGQAMPDCGMPWPDRILSYPKVSESPLNQPRRQEVLMQRTTACLQQAYRIGARSKDQCHEPLQALVAPWPQHPSSLAMRALPGHLGGTLGWMKRVAASLPG